MSRAQPSADKLDQARAGANSADAKFQKNSELMIDVHAPESKSFLILSGQTMSETRGGADFQIVEHNHGTDGSVTKREEKRLLALGGIRRAVHQNKARLFEACENGGMTFQIERIGPAKNVFAAL